MRLKVLAALAVLLRVQFKVDGVPYGASLTSAGQARSATDHSRS